MQRCSYNKLSLRPTKRLLNLVLNPHRNIADQLSALAHNITLY